MSERLLAILVGIVATTAWCVATAQEKGASVPEDDVGLRKVPVLQAHAPPETVYSGVTPGENKRIGRDYDQAPPMIPHTVEDYLPITTRNECVGCHVNPPRTLVDMGITPIPPTHYVDRAGKEVGGNLASVKEIYKGFYNCSMCHAPQADATPLVGNTFRGD